MQTHIETCKKKYKHTNLIIEGPLIEFLSMTLEDRSHQIHLVTYFQTPQLQYRCGHYTQCGMVVGEVR